MVVLTPSAVTVLGLAAKVVVVLFGEPAMNATVVVSLNAPIDAVTVLFSAVVDTKVAEKLPFASELPEPGVSVLFEPVQDKDTACPLTGFP